MQILEILKAVDADSKVIILDEPTAALSPNEVSQLFVIVRRLIREKNIGFIPKEQLLTMIKNYK